MDTPKTANMFLLIKAAQREQLPHMLVDENRTLDFRVDPNNSACIQRNSDVLLKSYDLELTCNE